LLRWRIKQNILSEVQEAFDSNIQKE